MLWGDGHTYSKKAVEQWLRQCGSTPRSPLTNQRLDSAALKPNWDVRARSWAGGPWGGPRAEGGRCGRAGLGDAPADARCAPRAARHPPPRRCASPWTSSARSTVPPRSGGGLITAARRQLPSAPASRALATRWTLRRRSWRSSRAGGRRRQRVLRQQSPRPPRGPDHRVGARYPDRSIIIHQASSASRARFELLAVVSAARIWLGL